MSTRANGGTDGTAAAETEAASTKVDESQPIPTPDELVARAVALRPLLRANQDETEKRGYPSREIREQIREAGFYKIYIPRRYGGYAYPLQVFQRVMMAIAQGCPSTGWFAAFGAGHALPLASYYSEKAQSECFGLVGDFQSPHAARPPGTVRPVDGGWIVNGTWNYASGVPYATHFMGNATILNADGTPAEGSPPRTVVVVVPADRFTMIENWGDTLGMRGSGSNSVQVEDAFVPTDYALDWSTVDKTKPTPGTELHGNPLYLGRIRPSYSGESQSVLIGTAKAALDSYEEILKTRTLVRPNVYSDQLRYLEVGHQRNFGQAMVLIDSAEALLMHSSEMHEEFGDRWLRKGIPFTDEEEERLMHMTRVAGRMAQDAIDLIFRSAGTSASRDGEQIQRAFRDGSVQRTHGASQFLDNVPLLARIHFGLTAPVRPPSAG